VLAKSFYGVELSSRVTMAMPMLSTFGSSSLGRAVAGRVASRESWDEMTGGGSFAYVFLR